MKRLKEINLSVDTSISGLNQHLNHVKPIKSGYSGQMIGDADSSISRRMQTIFKEEDEDEENEMDRDDLILEMVYNECQKSYMQKITSEQLILDYSNGDIPINEGILGATYEAGKAYIEDLVKNLLSSGAIVLSGGFAGDTIVDIIYALKRTKEVYDIYNGIMNSVGILKDFFQEMEKIDLKNNVDEIKKSAYGAIIKLANANESLLGKVDGKSISNLAKKVKNYINELKDKFIAFLKSANKSIGDWIGTFIPDDFGAGSALYKGIINDIINSAMEDALSSFLSITEKVPGEIGSNMLDRQGLTDYLKGLIDSIHEAADENFITRKAFDLLGIESIKDDIGPAIDLYAKIMKYMIAFFSITEGLASGELLEEIENYNEEDYLKDKEKIQQKLDTKISYGDLDFGKLSDYIPDDFQDQIKSIAESHNKKDDLILEKLYNIQFLDRRKRTSL